MRLLIALLVLTWVPGPSLLLSQDSEQGVLLKDDFEDGASAPKGWRKGARVPGVAYHYEKKNGNSGKRSLCLEKSANRYFPVAQWSRKIKLKKDRTDFLKVTSQIRAEGVTKAIVDVIFLDDRGKWISHEWASYVGAKNNGDPPVSHDWKSYSQTVKVPASTNRVELALQIYGPGKVWFDDVKLELVDGGDGGNDEDGDGETANESVPLANQKTVKIGSSKGHYLLVGDDEPDVEKGLMIVLPGGRGDADFHPFVSTIHARSLGKNYVLAQPLSTEWTPGQFRRIVWPTGKSRVDEMGFTTEELVEAVVKDVKAKQKIDAKRVFVLAWSSGGPAAYAALLKKESPLTGGILAMSVFYEQKLPDVTNGKGRSFYILHSEEDSICRFSLASDAYDLFQKNGIRTKLEKYAGGHGWHGDVFGNISAGVRWLEKDTN